MEHGNPILGLGGAVDYEIDWSTATIDALVREHGLRASDLSMPDVVDDERSLLVALLTLLRDGRGGERYVTSSGIVEAFASRFSPRPTLGGTGVRAALAMNVLGIPSTVHVVSEDPTVRRLLPAGVERLCGGTVDELHPHLIVQYDAGTRVRVGDVELVAPHANRVIYAHDPPNQELRLHSELGAALSTAPLLLVSGFNSMQDVDLLRARVAELRSAIGRMPAGSLVVYEDAGFHVARMQALVNAGLAGVVDVHSMNEDEMQGYLGRSVDLLDPGAVHAAVGGVRSLIAAPTVVVHTKHWALAVGDRADSLALALRGGVTMAGARYVHGEALDAQAYAATWRRPVQAGGAAVVAGLDAAFGPTPAAGVAAYDLDVADPTTIGLGDAFVGGMLAEILRSRASDAAAPLGAPQLHLA